MMSGDLLAEQRDACLAPLRCALNLGRTRPAGAWLLALAALALCAGCDDERYGDQRGVPDAGVDVSVPDAGGVDAAPDSGGDASVSAVRTLLTRNPYGNTSVTGNLLVDGDFEFSGSDGQYGWIAFSSQGLRHETGGLCRSGVSCGRMTNRSRMLAYAVAAPGAPMRLELWTKPEGGDCGAVAVYVIGLVSRDTPLYAQATAKHPTADANGWCLLAAATPVVTEQPGLYLEKDGQGDVLIDDAVLLPSSAQARLIQPRVSEVQRARIVAAAEEARRRRRFGAAKQLKP